MYVIFNKEQGRVLCKGEVMTYWTGNLSLITELSPIIFKSNLKAKWQAWVCDGLAVEVKLEEIPEETYELGNYEYFWVMDKLTNIITKTERFVIQYLDKASYSIVNWD